MRIAFKSGFNRGRRCADLVDPNVSSASGAICLGKSFNIAYTVVRAINLYDRYSERRLVTRKLNPKLPRSIQLMKPQVLTLKSTLISLQSLLNEPVPDDPQDAEVAKHFLSDRASFTATAKHWAQAYAQAPVHKQPGAGAGGGPGTRKVTDAEMAGLSEASVAQFVDMGFERVKVVSYESHLFTSRGESEADWVR